MSSKPIFFATQSVFRKWLLKNHDKEKELFLGYYKISSGKPSITWSQSVDEALCFGWIDGIRRSIDSESYVIRFTPRRVSSSWSDVNLKKVDELSRLGLMTPAGLQIFEKRKLANVKKYSGKNISYKLDEIFIKVFKANKKAWAFFCAQTPSYQKVTSKWVVTAKKEETRLKRLTTLIKDSEAGRKIKPMRNDSKK
ncbi:MAG: bacteriocin-protection protein [Ignavibacteriae bacterium HGW-Ignavibacteriae-3]|nr:MAG: bacteriocin-protection protein [Ignavibacteriae bacterium HGW-Ignavibacteriae-3]